VSTTPMSPEIFKQTEFRDYKDHAVWLYLCVTSDMAGVCPIKIRSVTSDLGMRKSMFLEILSHFESVGLIEIGPTKECVWVIGKCDWTLYSGKAQQKQFTSVSNRLRKASKSSRMGEDFAERAAQVVAAQYGFTIPLPKPSQSLWIESESESNTDTDTDAEGIASGMPPVGPTPQPIKSWTGRFDEKAQLVYQFLQFSTFAHAVNRSGARKWVQALVDQYPEPDYPADHVLRAVERMVEWYAKKGKDPPHDDDVMDAIWRFVRRQFKQKPEKPWQEEYDEYRRKKTLG